MAIKIEGRVYVTLMEMVSILGVTRAMADYWISRGQISGIINMDDVDIIESHLNEKISGLKKRKYKNYLVPLDEVVKKREFRNTQKSKLNFPNK